MMEKRATIRETFVELDKKLVELEKKVKVLEFHYDNMLEKTAQIERMAETVTQSVQKERELGGLVDMMLNHGERSETFVKYLLGFLHEIKIKCGYMESEMKTIADMKRLSKGSDFKQSVLSVFPGYGLLGVDLAAFLCILDFLTQEISIPCEAAMYIRTEKNSEFSPLCTLDSENKLQTAEAEVREILKFISVRQKLDKKTRNSLRRFIAVAQCTRSDRPVREFPDPFLVKEILGLK